MGVWARLRHRLGTRACKACGERHSRKLPYCPVCKTLPGHDGIDRRSGDWGEGSTIQWR